MFTRAAALMIDAAQKQQLESWANAGTTPQGLARKCEVILLASQGVSNHSIAQRTGLSRPTVLATRAAFSRHGCQALRQSQKRQRSARVLTPELQQKILDTTLQTRPADATQWSVRSLARPEPEDRHRGGRRRRSHPDPCGGAFRTTGIGLPRCLGNWCLDWDRA